MKSVTVGTCQVEITTKTDRSGMSVHVVDGRQYKQESVALLAALTVAKRQYQTQERIKQTATSGVRRFSLF